MARKSSPSVGSAFHSLQATSQALQPMQIELSVKKPTRSVKVMPGTGTHSAARALTIGTHFGRELQAWTNRAGELAYVALDPGGLLLHCPGGDRRSGVVASRSRAGPGLGYHPRPAARRVRVLRLGGGRRPRAERQDGLALRQRRQAA